MPKRHTGAELQQMTIDELLEVQGELDTELAERDPIEECVFPDQFFERQQDFRTALTIWMARHLPLDNPSDTSGLSDALQKEYKQLLIMSNVAMLARAAFLDSQEDKN